MLELWLAHRTIRHSADKIIEVERGKRRWHVKVATVKNSVILSWSKHPKWWLYVYMFNDLQTGTFYRIRAKISVKSYLFFSIFFPSSKRMKLKFMVLAAFVWLGDDCVLWTSCFPWRIALWSHRASISIGSLISSSRQSWLLLSRRALA